jgi:hypothetical protein
MSAIEQGANIQFFVLCYTYLFQRHYECFKQHTVRQQKRKLRITNDINVFVMDMLHQRQSLLWATLTSTNVKNIKHIHNVVQCDQQKYSDISRSKNISWKCSQYPSHRFKRRFFCMTAHLHISWWCLDSTSHCKRDDSTGRGLEKWCPRILLKALQMFEKACHCPRELFWRKFCVSMCRVTYCCVINQFQELFEGTQTVTVIGGKFASLINK